MLDISFMLMVLFIALVQTGPSVLLKCSIVLPGSFGVNISTEQ